eukprot:12415735-Karenia_brevis.AAC.1
MFEEAVSALSELGLCFTFEAKKTAYIHVLQDSPGSINLSTGDRISNGRNNLIVALGNVIAYDGKLPHELENRAAKMWAAAHRIGAQIFNGDGAFRSN